MVDTRAMEELAERYALELDSQFRTLNIFVQKSGGEIGRAHESYLRTLLSRFVPKKFRVGTGFIVNAEGASSQQDVLIFDAHDNSPLYEIGDVSVVPLESAIGTLEVKTRLGSEKDFRETIQKLCSTWPRPHFFGLFAWEGLSAAAVCQVVRDMYLSDAKKDRGRFPAFTYVRSQLVLIRNDDGNAESPPFRLMKIGEAGATDGQALLALISTLWLYGLQSKVNRPEWLQAWDNRVIRAIPFLSMEPAPP